MVDIVETAVGLAAWGRVALVDNLQGVNLEVVVFYTALALICCKKKVQEIVSDNRVRGSFLIRNRTP